MSWIFGYFGKGVGKQINSPEIPLYYFKDSKFILFAGGNKQTCFFRSESQSSCWAVAGVGLKSTDYSFRVCDTDEWDALLTANKKNFRSLNGHFTVIKYSEGKLKFFTDELGLREIYIVQLSDGFGFTTRIDWLKHFIDPELDLVEFGSRWLLQNQISGKSIIKNVIRLVCASASIRNHILSIEQNPWKPDFEIKSNSKTFDSVLTNILSIRDKNISLSLSGGLDSRLLLSYLAKKDFNLWETHTFGDPNHPDSRIACDLLKGLNRKNEIIDDKTFVNDKLIEQLKSYAVQSIVTNPASAILNLRFYDRLTGRNKIIIDGGFGEIWRKAFANRLLLIGRSALLKRNSKSVSGLLRYRRADIFNKEAFIEMEKGISEQFDAFFEDMPVTEQLRPERWIELFSIRTRLTNYYAPEQSRIDQFVISFMPLVQKDVLNLLFGLDNSEKNNGKMFKQLIKQNSSVLTKQALVKGNIIHPFNASSLGSRIHLRLKNKIGLSFKSEVYRELFSSLKEFIGDTVHSAEVRNYEYYDRVKIERMMSNFLSGEEKYNSEIDWFLSFELFRQGISK